MRPLHSGICCAHLWAAVVVCGRRRAQKTRFLEPARRTLKCGVVVCVKYHEQKKLRHKTR